MLLCSSDALNILKILSNPVILLNCRPGDGGAEKSRKKYEDERRKRRRRRKKKRRRGKDKNRRQRPTEGQRLHGGGEGSDDYFQRKVNNRGKERERRAELDRQSENIEG